MPRVPVLIDEGMPPSHRRALELLLPDGVQIIVLPLLSNAIVERLWFAPSPMHMPFFEKMNSRFCWDFLASPPVRLTRLIREMNRRIDLKLASPSQVTQRVFLARKPSQHRKMVNRDVIEAIATTHDFIIVHPEDLAFDDQIHLVRSAQMLVGPEGSAMFLAFFARPGTRVCILNHPYTIGLAVLTGQLEGIGLDALVFTGPFETENEQLPHFADYRIDPEAFEAFVEQWGNELFDPANLVSH
jgi:hypothetical protein